MHYYCVKSVRIRSYSYFPSFGLNTDREMRTRITLNMDTFHTVLLLRNKSNSKHFLGNIPQRNLHEVFAEISKKKCFSRQPRIQTFEMMLKGLFYCVKSVLIQSFSDPYFVAFRLNTERCGVSLSYSVQIRENTGQRNSEYRHFSRSV